jgi:hypothetical protein
VSFEVERRGLQTRVTLVAAMRTRRNDDSLDQEDDDPEDPAAADQDAHDDPETVGCPFCGREISELADVCPHCGNFVHGEDAPGRGKPLWVIVVVAALLVAMLYGAIRLFW